MTTGRVLRVAVAGLGYWGPNIARNLAALPAVELAWCCDPSESERSRAARQFPGARLTADFGGLVSTQVELAKVEIKEEVAQAGRALRGRRQRGADQRLQRHRSIDDLQRLE